MLLLVNEQSKHQLRGGQPHVQSSLGLHWHIPYERANLAAIFKMVLYCNSLFSHIQPLEWLHECSQSSTEIFPHLNQENHSKVCYPHDIVIKTCFEHFRHATVFLNLKKNSMEMHCLPLQNYRWHLTSTTIHVHWKATLSRLTQYYCT